MHRWQESFYVSSLPFNNSLFLGFFLHNRMDRIRHHYICSSSWRRIRVCHQPGTIYIHISRAATHYPSDHISLVRHQRRYFLWHYLPLRMALRWMADGQRPRAVCSRLLRSSKHLSLCRPFCAPARRPPAIYELTLLVTCRGRMDHFWHRFFVLGILGTFAALDWRIHTRSIGRSYCRRID